MNEYLKEIVPISVVLLTFIGTMINIYYTRRNIKTTKYIDTITSNRIKWLNIIRTEVVDIITNIDLTLKRYSKDIKDIQYEAKNYEMSVEDHAEDQARLFDAKTSSALGKQKVIWSESDFVNNLYIFKLRLNPEEDNDIIEIIDYFIKFYVESEYKSEKEIAEAKEKTRTLINLTQKLLKEEWEKVKKETKGKSLIKRKP